MVATSGAQLLPQEAVKNLRERLLPLTTILTPNLDEARLLLRDAGSEPREIKGVDDLKHMSQAILSLGPKWVLLKGGHMPLTKARAAPSSEDAEKHIVVDVLAHPDGTTEVFEAAYIESKHTHGTGCTLACKWHGILWRWPGRDR